MLPLAFLTLLCCGCGGSGGDNGVQVSPPETPGPNAPVVQWHNDRSASGVYPFETSLTTSNVNSATFGKLFQYSTDGPAEAQPLYVPQVAIAGKGTHNVVYVATMNDKVYAFDADSNTGANANPLWVTNVGPYVPAHTGGNGDAYNQGVVSTPAIDLATNTMYVFSKNMSGSSVVFKIHALDITSGVEKLGGPYTVQASVKGTKGGVNGEVDLVASEQYQRCGLLLLNGILYVGIGGIVGDNPPDRGWILGFQASTLHHVISYTTAPDAGIGSQTADAGGAIWMSGAAPSTDGKYLYVATGNGDFNANAGGNDYSDSVLKLAPSGNTMQVVDYFTPSNEQALSNQDLDVGSSNPIIVTPAGISGFLIVQLSKYGTRYVLNPSAMGKFNAGGDHIVQETHTGGTVRSAPVYFNGVLYYDFDGGPLTGYRVTSSGLGGVIGTTSARFQEANPSITCNNKASNVASTAIVWIVENAGTAVLHAYQASNLKELYNSATTRDQAGGFMKFNTVTIADGRVFVNCTNGLYVYGLGKFMTAKVPRL